MGFRQLLEKTIDLGDLPIEGTLSKDHKALAHKVSSLLSAGTIPIILGGGHETSYGHYLAYVLANREHPYATGCSCRCKRVD